MTPTTAAGDRGQLPRERLGCRAENRMIGYVCPEEYPEERGTNVTQVASTTAESVPGEGNGAAAIPGRGRRH